MSGSTSFARAGATTLPGAFRGIPTLEPGYVLGRFRVEGLLGEGGSGQVWRATDPSLGRTVALKILSGTWPSLLERFLQEAQLQARVQHENVCRVYEVGEAEGWPYIVMQLIEGRTFGDALPGMPLDQRVRVLEAVADAVHAAHRKGLIHRDIKPGNVMIETGEGGEPKPYVLDFGLARDQEAPGLTQSGLALGTPSYMAPEQARGELAAIDRRTDVYALGATLYEALTLVPPFRGQSAAEVMLKLVSEEPLPPRKLDPSIPIDLETIALRCLAKEPAARYESAMEVAEELRRYLAGEPIRSRPVTLLTRLVKRARRNKPLVAVGAAALVLTGALAGLALQTRHTAAERARLAGEFGRTAREIESLRRIAELQPLHDVRREKALLRQRLRAIETEMSALGEPAAAAGHYALGRGALALRDWASARRHLSRAEELGYHGPELSVALGQALGAAYQAGLEQAERIASREVREARRKELARDLREPALRYLKQGAGAELESARYVEGLIALYEKRWDDALASARAARMEAPWLYEAARLEGDVLAARAVTAHGSGDSALALDLLEQALAAYTRATDVARSDAAGHAAACGALVQVLEVTMSSGESPEAPYRRALAACDSALRADPESLEGLNRRSRAHFRFGEWLLGTGQDPRAALASAAEAAREAARLDPRNADAHANIATPLAMSGVFELRSGGDPRPVFEEAIRGFRRAVELDPRLLTAQNNLGNTYRHLGDYLGSRGEDPLPAYEEAVRRFDAALAINATFTAALSNLGAAHALIARTREARGLDSRPSMERAAEAFAKSVEINPRFLPGIQNGAAVCGELADLDLSTGRDPGASLDKGEALVRKGLEVNPNEYGLWDALGGLQALRGLWRQMSGGDPADGWKQAISSYRRAVELNPRAPGPSRSLVENLRVLAAGELRAGRNASAPLAEAARALERAHAAAPGDPYVLLEDAELSLVRARSGSRRADELRSARASLDRALAANPRDEKIRTASARCFLALGDVEGGLRETELALESNPRSARATGTKGRLLLLQATRLSGGAPGREKLAGEAAALLQKAISLDATERLELAEPLREALELSRAGRRAAP